MAVRSATTVGMAGLGLAGVLAGAVFLAGPTATAATACAAATPSESPSEEPSEDPSESASPTAAPTQNGDGSLVGTVVDLLPLGEGQGTTTATPDPSSSPSDEPTDEPTDEPSETSSPSPTASQAPAAKTTLALSPRRITFGQAVKVTGTGLPGCSVKVYTYTRPSTTYKVVRTGTIADNGTFAFELHPSGNTRGYATSEGAQNSPSTPVNVRFLIGFNATRESTRTYLFEGKTYPSRKGTKVLIYRTTSAGTEKIGEATSISDGRYAFRRTFKVTGSSTFYAVVATTVDNDGNRSRSITTTVR